VTSADQSDRSAAERIAGDAIGASAQSVPIDVESIRRDFPILERQVHGRRLVYLDSAASSQRPRQVLEAMRHYYETSHANVHRGVYTIAEEADELYESARRTVGRFVGAPVPEREVIFTKNATEALNLVAYSWGRSKLREGDVVVVTVAEHHANLLPWLVVAEERGAKLRVIDIDDTYRLALDDLERMLQGAKIVACTLMSNVLGTIPPFRWIADAAHDIGAVVVADGAQFVPHMRTDVGALGCDFLVFSGHKMLGPTGIGVLWGRESLLDEMPPFLTGGGMIRDVRFEGFTPNVLPWKFEAGTPPIAEAVGLAAAVQYLEGLGLDALAAHERALTAYALARLEERFGGVLRILGPPGTEGRGGVLSMLLGEVHPHDLAQVLDEAGVCVRAGHHCAKPLMRRLGTSATARASLYVYNDVDDVDALVEGLDRAARLFGCEAGVAGHRAPAGSRHAEGT
jgi:cysteine desulfurase/selenocysteine lyase